MKFLKIFSRINVDSAKPAEIAKSKLDFIVDIPEKTKEEMFNEAVKSVVRSQVKEAIRKQMVEMCYDGEIVRQQEKARNLVRVCERIFETRDGETLKFDKDFKDVVDGVTIETKDSNIIINGTISICDTNSLISKMNAIYPKCKIKCDLGRFYSIERLQFIMEDFLNNIVDTAL